MLKVQWIQSAENRLKISLFSFSFSIQCSIKDNCCNCHNFDEFSLIANCFLLALWINSISEISISNSDHHQRQRRRRRRWSRALQQRHEPPRELLATNSCWRFIIVIRVPFIYTPIRKPLQFSLLSLLMWWNFMVSFTLIAFFTCPIKVIDYL